ncbi:XrtA/PEP-CTERM system histidine kinase PrsK [Reinekea sp.]|jgi:putative PEP-CTERM system histidine kinase|uniref:XrtA/PEP-CTERM system histidine kinase PrsK n=1 Tax=Reinekea sp. TaxID=1970455 RepID=UPI002A812ED4|nr:XrtA/PEP-CTERM system histidine kinase PrsK [Reinekea sp.]
MDYFTVTQAAFLSALITTASLLGLLLVQAFQQPWKGLLLIGVVGQFIWTLTLFFSYSVARSSTTLILSVELLRFVLWLACLILLLAKRSAIGTWPKKMFALVVLTAVLICTATYLLYFGDSSASALSLVLMLLATLSLVVTEQVVRNLNTHRMIKLIGLGLTFLFALDILMYGHNFISHATPTGLWQARAALAFTLALALAIGSLIFNESGDSHYLFAVSRPAAFFSTSLLFSVLLIAAVSLGSRYLEEPGFLASYLFTLALLVALLLLFSLIISQAIRQHFEVFISKHFFALKYDYRIEWLKAIKSVSGLERNRTEYYLEALNILCTALRAESGSLWINTGSECKEMARTLTLSGAPETVSVNEAFIRTMLQESWIYVPGSRLTSLAEHNRLLPAWIEANADIWLVAPLISQMRLVGFGVMARSRINTAFTFEDRDLMTNISTQVASHLLLHQQEQVISNAKQLETYNRLSAFIMHDINNVIAQLALIGNNAQRHRSNPAFVDDMIKTVHNATTRMQALVQKFNPAAKEKRTAFWVSDLLTDLCAECALYQPVPILFLKQDFTIDADKQRLTLALKNLVRNAQEASSQNGQVTISAHLQQGRGQLVVADDGQGMSQSFVNEELFRPFSTTKTDKGLGIGAYLTKSYIEHLGATLNVYSKEGLGTRFEITFG